MSRMPMIVANWKAGPAQAEVAGVTQRMVTALAPVRGVEAVICPPFPWLGQVAQILAGSEIQLGAQTVAPVDGGTATGEVPASMLRGWCRYVLVGHYERRIHCGERDGDVRKQLAAALEGGLRPILCVGESVDALEAGAGASVCVEQLEAALNDVALDDRLVIAYAPSWTTIGRAHPPGPDYANELCGILRETLADIATPTLADSVRIIYGGRLTESNIAEVAAQPDLDGALVGSGATNADRMAAFGAALAGS